MYTQVEADSVTRPQEPAQKLGSVTRALNRANSLRLFQEAQEVLPAGASSLVRVNHHEPFPIILSHGAASKVWDVDGNEYVDLLNGYGALILGHSAPPVTRALKDQAEKGTILGTTTELEVEVAKKVQDIVPCADLVAFANTGTEATMEAIRIARAFTGRDKVLKFEGHYHGHHDYVLFSVESPSVVAGLEHAPNKLPFCPGIPETVARTVEVAPWNNIRHLERIVKRAQNDLAAIIMEPVMGSAGIIPPADGYLDEVSNIADEYGVLLIFDEVLTGFRVALGGAQQLYHVRPDIACFAKALGGGLPVAAVTGRDDILSMIRPGGMGYGGTYNGNPLCLAAAKATLDELSANEASKLKLLNEQSAKLTEGLRSLLAVHGHNGLVQSVGSMFQVSFTDLKRVTNYRQSLRSDLEKYAKFHDLMLSRGVYFHPDGSERMVLSTAHTDEDVKLILAAADESLSELAKK